MVSAAMQRSCPSLLAVSSREGAQKRLRDQRIRIGRIVNVLFWESTIKAKKHFDVNPSFTICAQRLLAKCATARPFARFMVARSASVCCSRPREGLAEACSASCCDRPYPQRLCCHVGPQGCSANGLVALTAHHQVREPSIGFLPKRVVGLRGPAILALSCRLVVEIWPRCDIVRALYFGDGLLIAHRPS